MALWGNKDSKTAAGTVSITTAGAVTGVGTAFTTAAKIGNTMTVTGNELSLELTKVMALLLLRLLSLMHYQKSQHSSPMRVLKLVVVLVTLAKYSVLTKLKLLLLLTEQKV
jgi:hypothetical protein